MAHISALSWLDPRQDGTAQGSGRGKVAQSVTAGNRKVAGGAGKAIDPSWPQFLRPSSSDQEPFPHSKSALRSS